MDQWAASRVQERYPLSMLKDAVIGVDASHYLDLRLNGTAEEPLKHALAGTPFCLRPNLLDDVEICNTAGCKLVFVFNGLDHINKSPPPSQSPQSAKASENAWLKYNSKDSGAVLDEFTKAKFTVEGMQRYFLQLLIEHKIDYLVAPYSAMAQLSYMVRLPEDQQYIDTIWGSTEYFLFGTDKVITNINQPEENGKATGEATFDWIQRSTCEERLKVRPDMLRDSLLLLGTHFTPTFPILERPPSKIATIQDAISLLNQAGGNVLQLCQMWREDAVVQQSDYADRYKKGLMSIRHHIILESSGTVSPMDFEHAPGDVHAFVGQNLPEELFYYLSKALVGPEALNWLTHGEVVLSLPNGVLDTEPYRRLLNEQLNPIRSAALKIISEPLNRYYQARQVTLRTWDDRNTTDYSINLREEPNVGQTLSMWRIKGADIKTARGKSPEMSLLACLRALKEPAFVKKSLTKTKSEHPALKTIDEVVANTCWRFLQIRGYVNEKHELTTWGKMLEAMLSKLDSSSNPENVAILAVELIRLGLLNGNDGDGLTVPTTDVDVEGRTNSNLIAKVACLGRVKHEKMGWSGPLDRQLLSFAWTVTALRSTLRVLIESIVATMFMLGDVSRDRSDWSKLVAR